MKTSGIEEFKSVLRRSALLIIAAVLLGSVVVNVVRQLGELGRYDTEARCRGISPRLVRCIRGKRWHDRAQSDGVDVASFIHLVIHIESGHCTRPASVKRKVREYPRRLRWRDTIAQCAIEVTLQLCRLAGSEQRRDHDETAVSLRKLGP